MIVLCKYIKGNYPLLVVPLDLTKKINETNFVASAYGDTIGFNEEEFLLTIKKRYRVYAILIVNGDIKYLINNDINAPEFLPADLFDIIEPSIDVNWSVSTYKSQDSNIFVMGYDDIVNNYKNMCNLISNEPSAVRKFIENKEHIELWGI